MTQIETKTEQVEPLNTRVDDLNVKHQELLTYFNDLVNLNQPTPPEIEYAAGTMPQIIAHDVNAILPGDAWLKITIEPGHPLMQVLPFVARPVGIDHSFILPKAGIIKTLPILGGLDNSGIQLEIDHSLIDGGTSLVDVDFRRTRLGYLSEPQAVEICNQSSDTHPLVGFSLE